MAKVIMRGNQALAEAALRAGCRFFCGYPITPQSEIMEYLAARMPEVGGHFVQSESEVAAGSMLLGAATTGFRVMTGSSGTGFTLKQDAISWMASYDLPGVFVNVCRYGSGLGQSTKAGQDAYLQATKGGGQGCYRPLVYGPGSCQEMVDLMALTFEKAEQYRTPVILLSDGALGQMMEPVELPEYQEPDGDKPWALKGKGKGKGRRLISPQRTDPLYEQHLREKCAHIAATEQRWEAVQTEDAEVILVAYGISGRVCKEAVRVARAKGLKLGLIRPISLWPFPTKPFEQVVETAKGFLVVEMSALGQMTEDVALSVKCQKPVYLYPSGPTPPKGNVILQMVEDILQGKLKEVF